MGWYWFHGGSEEQTHKGKRTNLLSTQVRHFSVHWKYSVLFFTCRSWLLFYGVTGLVLCCRPIVYQHFSYIHNWNYDNNMHIIVLFSFVAVTSFHPMSPIICIIIVFITELYSIAFFLELLMYFCYNTSYFFSTNNYLYCMRYIL